MKKESIIMCFRYRRKGKKPKKKLNVVRCAFLKLKLKREKTTRFGFLFFLQENPILLAKIIRNANKKNLQNKEINFNVVTVFYMVDKGFNAADAACQAKGEENSSGE